MERINALTTCRQTKIIMPRQNFPKTKQMVQHDRETISLLTQLITGHAHLNRHNWIINKENQAKCRLCSNDTETPIHLLADCEPLWRDRQEIFGQTFLDHNRPIWEVEQLVKFLKLETIRNLFNSVNENNDENCEE